MGEDYLNNYEFNNPSSGASFYGYNAPIDVSITDYGDYVNFSLVNTVTSEVNDFTYSSSYSAGGYYGFATTSGIAIDNVSLSYSEGSQAQASEVAEPGSLALMGLGLLGAGAYRRRSKQI